MSIRRNGEGGEGEELNQMGEQEVDGLGGLERIIIPIFANMEQEEKGSSVSTNIENRKVCFSDLGSQSFDKGDYFEALRCYYEAYAADPNSHIRARIVQCYEEIDKSFCRDRSGEIHHVYRPIHPRGLHAHPYDRKWINCIRKTGLLSDVFFVCGISLYCKWMAIHRWQEVCSEGEALRDGKEKSDNSNQLKFNAYLAKHYYDYEKTIAAMDWCREFLRMVFPEIYLVMGSCCLALGLRQEARECWKKRSGILDKQKMMGLRGISDIFVHRGNDSFVVRGSYKVDRLYEDERFLIVHPKTRKSKGLYVLTDKLDRRDYWFNLKTKSYKDEESNPLTKDSPLFQCLTEGLRGFFASLADDFFAQGKIRYRELNAFYKLWADFSELEAFHEKCIAADPDNQLDYIIGMEGYYDDYEKPEEGVAWYRKFLHLEMPEIYVNLGHHYFALGLDSEAIDCYNKGLALATDKDNKMMCLQGIGTVFLSQDNYSEALKYYLRAEEICPESCTRENIAICYEELGKCGNG